MCSIEATPAEPTPSPKGGSRCSGQVLAALAAGLLFGLGLTVSQMATPAKVLGFLDLAGDWDPSFAVVLAGAVATAAIGWPRLCVQAESLRGPCISAESFYFVSIRRHHCGGRSLTSYTIVYRSKRSVAYPGAAKPAPVTRVNPLRRVVFDFRV
jgi:Family of unknown function (DUF6691)